MAELKTKKTKKTKDNPAGFLAKLTDEEKRKDCETLVKLMKKATKAEAKMWGPGIVGFGDVHLVYESGRELDWFPIGFSPRKDALTLYLGGGLEMHAADLEKLGKHRTGKGCLYIKRLSEVDTGTLERMIQRCVKASAPPRGSGC